ncbi:MAG: rhomboid family intramembrane serine protease, partial [Bacteroidetes bacterium]
IFIMTIVTSLMAFKDPQLMHKFILNPYDVVRDKEFYRVFTSGLIHANYVHLGFNMITYYFFAFYLEQILGHWQFAVLYVASLALSDITTIIKYKDHPSYNSLGASGAVSAVVLSIILCQPDIQLLLFFAIPMPGWLLAIAYIGYSYYASKRSYDNINHDAHLWGALSGIILTIVLKPGVLQNFGQWLGV